MKITSVRVRKLEDAGLTKAFASVVLNDEIVINRVRVLEGKRGLFVALPSIKGADGEYRDIAHPITAEGRKMVNQAVLDAYQQVIQQEQCFDSLYQDGYEFKVIPGEDGMMKPAKKEHPQRMGESEVYASVNKGISNGMEQSVNKEKGPPIQEEGMSFGDGFTSAAQSPFGTDQDSRNMERNIPEPNVHPRSSIRSQLAEAEKVCASQPIKQDKQSLTLD